MKGSRNMMETMKALVKEKDMCVLATVGGGTPHCSLMAYVSDGDCREIYLVTHKQTTKYRNLTENPAVSLLIDTREEHQGSHRKEAKALTVAGVYERIEDRGKMRRVRDLFLERHPHLRELMDHPDAETLCIRIVSYLLLDGINDAYFDKP